MNLSLEILQTQIKAAQDLILVDGRKFVLVKTFKEQIDELGFKIKSYFPKN